MSLLRDPDRFSLPVANFIRQRLKEEYPQFPVGQGSAFGDVLVLPAAFLLQQFRDELNALKRNMSPLNYQIMLEEELDRLAANFLVKRRTGLRSYGTVRVYFDAVQPVTIDKNAVFFDDQNHRWNPISSILLTAEDLALNSVADTGEYYVDVPVIAEAVGPDYQAEEEQVNQFAGIVGATRCVNLIKFSEGKADDTNTDVYMSILDSVTNNDLVKSRAIRKVLKATFQSIRAVEVVGYGDAAMTRDTIDAVISLQELLPFSYARKYNLPLDENGDVSFFDKYGNVVLSPIGGVVGAIEDLTGLDYNALNVTLDGQTRRIVSVQPDYRVRMYHADGMPVDPDEGDYKVTRVEEVPVEPNGVPVKVIRLDRPFRDPTIGIFNPLTDSEKYKYTILGPTAINRFHVGGKVDIYVDSSADVEESVIIPSLSEVTPGSGIAEVPIVTNVPLDPVTGLPLFENNKAFFLPFMGVVKVEQIAADNDQAVERTLVAGAQYSYIAAEFRSQFTMQAYDVIRIFGNDENGNPIFIGKRIKITYLTNRDIPLMQQFIDSSEEETKCADLAVYPMQKVFLDVQLKYSGNLTSDEVVTLIRKYILSKKGGDVMTAQEISVMLGVAGISDIEHPIRLVSYYQTGTGQIETRSSEDRLDVQTHQKFYPYDPMSVEKLS